MWWDWLLDDVWDAWDEFHVAIAWGNIATVTVAIAAIIVSAWFNVRTLRSADDRWRQERLDTRDDKLRAELATLLATVGELLSRHDVLFGRLVRHVNALNLDELTDEQLEEPTRQARSIAFEELADLQRRISTSTITIKMLTANTAVTRPVELMQVALRAEQRAVKSALSIPTIRHLTWDSLRRQFQTPSIWFQLAMQRVIDYCLQCLGTNIPDTRSPTHWNYPWANSWR
jgi:hypothetical protein